MRIEDQNSEFEEKLNSIESTLVEQEHRPIQVVLNFINRRNKWPNNKAIQQATIKALVWRILFSPATVAVSGGIIGIITLVLLFDQNKEIRKQNEFFRQQILFTQLQKAKENLYPENYFNHFVKRNSVRELIRTTRLLNSNNERVLLDGADLAETDLSEEEFINVDFVGTQFSSGILNRCKFINCNFKDADFSTPFNDVTQCDSILFKECVFENTDLRHTSFYGSNFQDCIFKWQSDIKIQSTLLINIDISNQDDLINAKKHGALTSIKEVELKIDELSNDSTRVNSIELFMLKQNYDRIKAHNVYK